MRSSRCLALVVAGVVACATGYAAARDRTDAFAWRAPLQLEGRDGLFSAELTPDVYRGAASPDLADLRVRNAAGESVPYALWSPAGDAVQKRAPVALPFFPLWAPAGTDVGTLSLRIEQGARGAIVGIKSVDAKGSRSRLAGYVVDASASDEPIQALDIDWKTPSAGFAGRVRVEASDDLAAWRPVAEGPLVDLQHDGQQLVSRRVALPRVKARYLRITWPSAQATPSFTAVLAEPPELKVDAVRSWARAAGMPVERAGETVFDIAMQAPVDRLRIEFDEPNTVVPVQIFARRDPQAPWRPVASATVYRIDRGGEPIASGDIVIPRSADRYWMIRADARSGGFGRAPPALSAGYVPQRVVFAARGAPPFELVFGNAHAAGGALPVATIVPGYRAGEAPRTALALVGTADRIVSAPSRWPDWLDLEPGDWKKLVLWGVLVCGVALLAWMALRLGRQVGEPRGGS